MTKAELVAKIAEEADLTQVQATKALNTFIAVVSEEVKENTSISVAGLGSFTLVQRAARQGFNPKTKEPIQIAPSKTVKFRLAKALKDFIN